MTSGVDVQVKVNGGCNVHVAVKVNAVQVPKGFYDETDGWHITYGDSDQDH